MDANFILPDPEFANFLFCVSKDPESWKNWTCLQVNLGSPPSRTVELNSGETVKDLIENHFCQVDGRIFMVGSSIFVVCRNISYGILKEMVRQLYEIQAENGQFFAECSVYDLSENIEEFMTSVQKTDFQSNKIKSFQNVFLTKDADYVPGDSKIMLVEDDPVARWLMRSALKGQGTLATASCAHKAYDVYASWQPNIVFLDIGLPDGNGYEVLGWIIRNDPGANVVMVSGNSGMENIEAALEMGAKGFIAKPFLKESLFHYIRKYSA